MPNYQQQIKDNILAVYGREPATLDELAECVRIMASTHRERRQGKRGKIIESNAAEVIGLSWDIRYAPLVSNSHSHPINGVENWGDRNKDAPTGYPGFLGRVWIRYKNEEGYCFGSDPLRKTLTHSGTGGIGGYGGPWENVMRCRYMRYKQADADFPRVMAFSWDYRFYLSDWPLIEHFVGKHQTWTTLNNKPFEIHHKYLWEDAETLARDQEFVNNPTTKIAIGEYNKSLMR